MKHRNKLTLALFATTLISSVAVADPPATVLNPGIAQHMTKAAGDRYSGIPGAALVPTGPCMAELSMDRFEITPSADGTSYAVSVTIGNIGTEAAIGAQTRAGGVLGISLEVMSNWNARAHFAQMADIDIIHPGTSRTFTGSVPANRMGTTARSLTARIDRGPDGPRCAYDARINNDGLGVSVPTVKAFIAAGNASYVRTR